MSAAMCDEPNLEVFQKYTIILTINSLIYLLRSKIPLPQKSQPYAIDDACIPCRATLHHDEPHQPDDEYPARTRTPQSSQRDGSCQDDQREKCDDIAGGVDVGQYLCQ